MPELSTQRLGFYINGRVALALLSHDEDGPACCPSMLVTQSMLGLLFRPSRP